jgi:hypothetical protein
MALRAIETKSNSLLLEAASAAAASAAASAAAALATAYLALLSNWRRGRIAPVPRL